MSGRSSSSGPPARDLASLAGLKLGNYRLERLVGRGRMGVVYLARDEALLRATAIKVLSWSVAEARGHDPVQWFLAEARVVARINHPRVVQIYGAARQGEYCYIAMEYVPGRSAEARVSSEGPMAFEVATDIVVQAASALHAAHAVGVVHRDVKPANLLVAAGGQTKLGDFGMALGPPDVGAGTAHVRVGTPYYTAPEIWKGEAATPASDIYSLGATYYHLLTGRPPYPAADVESVEQAHLRAPIPDPRAIVPVLPASCAALLRRALAKAPAERHASAQELLLEARHVLQQRAPPPVAAPSAAASRGGAKGAGAPPIPPTSRPPPGKPAAGSFASPPAAARGTPPGAAGLDLTTIAGLEGVRGAVLGDLSGGFRDAVREGDGESIAAVMGVVATAAAGAGGPLGLGPLRWISIGSESTACVVAVDGDSVVTAWVEPGAAAGEVERFLDASSGREA